MKVKWLLICLFFCTSSLLWAQKQISGTVTSEGGEPLIGVNVVEKGTVNGASTDLDGNFTLTVAGESSVLVISYTGMRSIEQPVGTQTQFNISLSFQSELLEAIVVSALGFKQDKDKLGSTASVVSANDVVRSGETGVINGLSGKAAGVRIIRSNGDPGAGSNILIRGANSIQGDGSPLIIVDGVPISNETVYGGGNDLTGGSFGGVSQQSRLNDINPNDIESIQVLKGASAGSLWGSRAANGVIVITTKQGQVGRLKVNYNFTYSLDEINIKHELQNKFGQGRRGSWSRGSRDSWGDRIADRSGAADVVDESRGYFEAPDGTRYYRINQKNSRETFTDKNFDAVFQNGNFKQHNLSLSGGNDHSQFFASFGMLNQDGIIRQSYYDRYNTRFNINHRFNDWFSMSAKSGYTNTQSNRIQQNSNVSGFYLGLLRTSPDFDNTHYIGTFVDADGVETPLRQRSYRRSYGETGQPTYNNPLWTVNEQKNLSAVNRFVFSTEMNIDPTDWLRFTIRGGLDDYTDTRDYFFPVFSSSDRSPGVFIEDIIGEIEKNLDVIGRATFDITRDIGLSATLGWNINDRQREFTSTNLTGFAVNSRQMTFELNSDPAAITTERTLRNRRSNRGYAILNFDFMNEFFLNFSNVAEAASTVNGTFYYPAVDGAWQFTKRMGTDRSVLSFGKLRASWGKVGVQPGAHRRDVVAESAGTFTYSTYSDDLEPAKLGGGFRVDDDQGDPDIKPEVKTEFEIGTDLRFFRDRLSFSATYYQNEIVDLIYSLPATPSSGVDTRYTNGGTMENKGFEFELGYNVFQNRPYSLNVFANFNRNRNEVTELRGVENIRLSGSSTIGSYAQQGEPFGVLEGTIARRNENGTLFLDENGFPDAADVLGIVGDPNAKWRGGAGFNFSWKDLSLSTLVEHSHGGVFADRTRIVLYAIGTHGDTGNEVTLTQDLKNVEGDVIPAGSTVRGNIHDWGAGPVLLDEAWYTTRGGGFGSGIVYDLLFPDATWTRLREVTLSYRLRNDWLSDKISLSNIEISLTGRNLVLWTDVKGIDPETNVDGVSNGLGIDYFTNPGTRSYLLSVSANF